MEEFARRVLFGTTLEDKLAASTTESGLALDMAPALPGRAGKLARFGKAEFPRSLANATARGQVLHFFANHELLALELMALALLRFPDAPAAFREGIFRTMSEEQAHLRLYLSRMRELGVDFGDLPLSRYFWDAMRTMRTPLEYVTTMSLTFEQANLDYSVHYRDACAALGDSVTADLLDRVYREEIGHVKHGVSWFNRWRGDAGESDWAAYLRLLEPPMTARRAKGLGFRVEGESGRARLAAGLSPGFIDGLARHEGSRGRPPALWWLNASAERELGEPARSSERFQPLYADLEHLLGFLAQPTDLVLTGRAPDAGWLGKMHAAGFSLPTFIESLEHLPRLSALRPWAWSPGSFAAFRPLVDKLRTPDFSSRLLSAPNFGATGLGKLYSKAWAAEFLGGYLAAHPQELFGGAEIAGRACTDEEAATRAIRELGPPVAVKAPFGASGSHVKKLRDPGELDGPLGGWIRNMIHTQGAIMIEPWLDKVADLSLQLEVSPSGTRIFEVRRQLTSAQRGYSGTLIGRSQFAPEESRLLAEALPEWKTLARALGRSLAAEGFEGPAGIDALIYRNAGKLLLKPLVELNPRLTMGRIALAVEERLAPGVPGAWLFLSLPKLEAGFMEQVDREHPPLFKSGRLASGVVWTTDPARATRIVTALVAGDAALGRLGARA